jgi:glycosyltransferase involved in cell wall biosynthesis
MPHSRDDNQLASISPKPTLGVSDNSNDFKKLNVLSISTEWFSTHGGVSTVNRELCQNLSALGHSVICAVESPLENEKKDARDYGVHLIGPTKLPGLDDRQSLIVMPLILPKDTHPDIIIGHGVHTGPAALTQQRFFHGSLRIHFVHVDSGAIEPLKKNMDHGTRADTKILKEKPLACSADLVVGIGPKLHKVAAHLILGAKPKPVLLRFDPGLTKIANVDDLPTRLIILIVGRMENSYLKGLDIIAAALGKLWDEDFLKEAPILRVRGAPANEQDQLSEYLFQQMNEADIPIQVRPFSTEKDLLYHDLIEASLVVMPSREEGFGLVALEALEEARPLLVSDKSGFAELIKEILPEIADEVIVLTQKNTENAVKKWASAIFNTLSNKQESFQKALKFQKEFVKKVTWERSTRNLVSNILYHTKELTVSPIPYYSFPKSQLITTA